MVGAKHPEIIFSRTFIPLTDASPLLHWNGIGDFFAVMPPRVIRGDVVDDPLDHRPPFRFTTGVLRDRRRHTDTRRAADVQ
jgi:hypothetical protein